MRPAKKSRHNASDNSSRLMTYTACITLWSNAHVTICCERQHTFTADGWWHICELPLAVAKASANGGIGAWGPCDQSVKDHISAPFFTTPCHSLLALLSSLCCCSSSCTGCRQRTCTCAHDKCRAAACTTLPSFATAVEECFCSCCCQRMTL